MTTQTAVKAGPEGVQEKIRELRELFTDAPRSRQQALDSVLSELTSQLCASGLLMENACRVARGLGVRIEGPVETPSDHFRYSLRRPELRLAPDYGRRRHDSTLIPSRSRRIFANSEDMPIVFVADSDISAYESLELLIKSEGCHPELFLSAQEFQARPLPTVPCCLILDVNLPGLDGHEVQKHLADRDIPIVFISECADAPLSLQAMKAGGVEFLTKPLHQGALSGVIRNAIERSREALRLNFELEELRRCYDSLTHRERDVMALVVRGLLNKQVGGELGIREITVKIHRSQVMRKMKAESLPDLVMMAARLGLRSARKH